MSANIQSQVAVVDADGQIVGRFLSKVAKMLLEGQRVVIVNAEKALFSGTRNSMIEEQKKTLEISSSTHPKHGPFHPRRPDTMITKIARGMLPRKKSRGIEAQKRLRVYISVPGKYEKLEKISFEEAKARKALSYYVTVGEIASSMGWRERD